MSIVNRILSGVGFGSHAQWTEQQALDCKLFLHIPKTAGTSFRKAVQDVIGRERVVRDYGDDAAETSTSIRDTVLASGDPLQVLEAVRRDQGLMLSGHLNVARYGGIFGLGNTLTILREPVSRVVSHYRHAVRHLGFKGDLMAFARKREFRNLQTRMLVNLDPAIFGLVGITEQYNLTLKIAEHRWGWKLKRLRNNVGDELGAFKVTADEQQRKEIAELNQGDQRRYDRASFVLTNTDRCLKQGIAVEPRGGITFLQPGQEIRGWGFGLGASEPLKVLLSVNGKERGFADCTHFSPALACWKMPRQGHIGFMASDIRPKQGDVVELRDTVHGILLDRKAVSAPG